MAGISIGFAIARLISAAMLLWDLSEPTDFYLVLMRSMVCGVALYCTYKSIAAGKFGWAWLFGGISIFFNPLIPFNLNAAILLPIRIIVALLFVESIYSLRKKTVKVEQKTHGLEKSLLRFVVMLAAVAGVMVMARLWSTDDLNDRIVSSKMGGIHIESPEPEKSAPQGSAQIVPWQKAQWHHGEYVTVEGTVVSTRRSMKSCILYFHQNHDKYFRATILALDSSRFPSNPSNHYTGKRVHVSGFIVGSRDRPEIILSDPAQIKIME